MKIFKKPLLIVAMACFSASASASITKWVEGGSSSSDTTKTNEPPAQVAPQPVAPPPTSQVSPQPVTPKNNQVRTETPNQGSNNRIVTAPPQSTYTPPQGSSQGGYTPSYADQQKEKLLIQYMARTQDITAGTDVISLRSEDYLAAVMLNGALIQAGMDHLTGSDNNITQAMYNKAIGCINSRNKTDLTQVAQGIIAKHTRITNVTKTINSGPMLSSGYKTKCQ